MAMLLFIFVVVYSCGIVTPGTIELPECEPPDYPEWGGYGPRQDFYVAGDVIHYYCDTDTVMGGNFYRRCEDTGDWIGNTPVCDSPSRFAGVNQTTTAEPEEDNGADRAVDNLRSSCTSTNGEAGNSWVGILETPGQLFRVMIFLPKVNVAYEVSMIKRNGAELSCGSKVGFIDNLNWEFHNCPEPNNTDVIGIRIRSLSSVPLQLCEVVAHTLTTPTCIDPHVRIENGRLQLNRKTASLVCDTGYSRSPANRLECVRTGVWNRKSLYCLERQWEVGNSEPISNQDP
ncbi:uncharacterized protein TNIN_409051 [Trichonephila inaurata madagascariensis]|uniref:Sushi domain-containing protein n=1 Tax=Trichonephila inaurata madagascariensis TaxID=2747483 RepID=A0A8X6KNC2_9ARAC|nr:uncharacterized protein TNIN_409051 [Trichonephila inaurata madagascariensis]